MTDAERGGAGLFRRPRRADLGPAHAALVDELRALIQRHGEPLDVLGEGVRHRLGKPVPARPGQRISALAQGSHVPGADELAALVGLCRKGAPAQVERFTTLRAAAVAERETTRRNALLAAPDVVGGEVAGGGTRAESRSQMIKRSRG